MLLVNFFSMEKNRVQLFWFANIISMRSTLITFIFTLLSSYSFGQYFQFSQYNFTPQRINPATVANSNYATATFDYRNQATGGGYHLNSNIINASYPLLSKKGQRWAGVGVTLMDDRSGIAGVFNTQEVGLSYAVNIPIAKYQSLSLGIKAIHQTRKMDLNDLLTGSQYIPDRGFEESVSNGENLGLLRNSFNTFSTGINWQQTDKKGNVLAYWGISFFDFNKPVDSFLGSDNTLSSTSVFNGGFQVYKKDKVSLFPEALFTRSGSQNVFNAGVVTRYDLNTFAKKPSEHLDIITKYVFGRSAILGLQLYREKFSIGFSYDFPVVKKNVGNMGAFEVALAVRRLVERNVKPKSKRKPSTTADNRNKISPVIKTFKNNVIGKQDSIKSKTQPKPKEDLSARLKHKQDSLNAFAHAGEIKHEPYILEKATLHFNFQFNSVELDEQAAQYLDDLAKALNDNPELKIKLVGHTDNVGSDKFNLKLSTYRAESMKQYLIEQGVAPERVLTEGKGMREPLQNNTTEEGRAINRRVEMTILYED
jgi:type IX secretion system PorP/SprF family membrane protein